MLSERLAMRHVRDVIRLKWAGLAAREIARRVGAAPSTVRATFKRAEAAGLGWPLPEELPALTAAISRPRWRLEFQWNSGRGEAEGVYLDDHSYR
ncbi:MAG: hypothetical protein WBV36_13865 [Terriglobales bacterium]